ncbi:transcription factor [Wolffia australiana]
MPLMQQLRQPSVLCPPWRSALERSLLWFGDVHPSVFVILLRHVSVIWQDPQENLTEDIRAIECRLRRRAPQISEMGRQAQERFMLRASKEFMEKGKVSADVADDVAAELAGLFYQANRLRKSVLEGIIEALDVPQAASYLKALAELVLR